MASSSSSSSLKPIIPSLLILSVLLQLVHSDQVVAEAAAVGYSQVQKMGEGIGCGGACADRCQLSKRPNLCKRACGTCCARCGCVPPGTSGNLDACPCYASITTRGNKRKCP